MKKFLLAVAAFAAVSSVSAQEIYNYFDAADVDADGWLWFDTQEKIDKYVGFPSMSGNPKVMLMADDITDSWAEPTCDPNVVGYNAEGEQGGEGSKKGGIILPPATDMTSINGGGIYMFLPDCAEFHAVLSSEGTLWSMFCGGGLGEVERVDFIRTNFTLPPFMKFSNDNYVEWRNIQDSDNKKNFIIKQPKGTKVTAAILACVAKPVIVHGIKVMTYTKASNSEAGIDDVLGGSALSLSFNGNAVNATEAADMSVYSVSGAKVAEAHGTTFALDNLAPGAYVVKAVSANGTATIKVVR